MELIDGGGQFEFFNSDERGTFKVYVEGMSTDGKIINETFTFQVE